HRARQRVELLGPIEHHGRDRAVSAYQDRAFHTRIMRGAGALATDGAPTDGAPTMARLLVARHAVRDHRLRGVGAPGAEPLALAPVGLRVAVILRKVGVAAFGLRDQIEVDLALRGHRGRTERAIEELDLRPGVPVDASDGDRIGLPAS